MACFRKGWSCPWSWQVLHEPSLRLALTSWLFHHVVSLGLVQAKEFTGPRWSGLWHSVILSTCSHDSKMGSKGKLYKYNKQNIRLNSCYRKQLSQVPWPWTQKGLPIIPIWLSPRFHHTCAQIRGRVSQKKLKHWTLFFTAGCWCFKSLLLHSHLTSLCSVQHHAFRINYEKATPTQNSSFKVMP